MNSPCKDCGSRYVGCHSDCEKYKDFRDEVDRNNDLKQKEVIRNSVWHSVGSPGYGTGIRRARKRRPKDAY